MFVRQIEETVFTSQAVDKLFAGRGLEVGAYRDDLSLRATLRALLLNRPTGKIMADVDEPKFSYQEIESEEGLRENIRKVILGYDFFDDSNYESILAISALSNFDNAQTIMDRVMEGLGDLLPGFRELKDLREFVKNYNVNARFLINEEKKRTVILVERLTNRTFHFLQAFISRYFPWYFDNNKLHGKEVELIGGLTKRTPDDYIAALNEIAKDENFKAAMLKSMLNGFESRMHERKLSAVQSQIRECRSAIERLEERFREQYQQMDRLTTEKFGLREKIRFGGDSHEVLDYFLSNKAVHMVSVNKMQIKFVVTTTIGNYDPEAFLSAANNEHSWIYKDWERDEDDGYPWPHDDIGMLMRAIFEEGVFRLRVCAAFVLNFETGGYDGIRGYNFGAEYADYTPNQHIQHYACLGNNAQLIRAAMDVRDYLGVLDACVASAGSANMNEPTTMSYFLNDILKKDAGKFIEMPDGTNVTPREALEWLKERAKKKEEQE